MALNVLGLAVRGLPGFETRSLLNYLLKDLASESTPHYRCHYCKILSFVKFFCKPYEWHALCGRHVEIFCLQVLIFLKLRTFSKSFKLTVLEILWTNTHEKSSVH